MGRVLGKSGKPVVAVFLSGEQELARSIALQMRELTPGYPHILISTEPVDSALSQYADEVIVLNSSSLLGSWLDLRRRLGHHWIALAPFLWSGDKGAGRSREVGYRALRWMPWLLAPRKLLAFNAKLERHHLRLSCPLASWRFLRGEAVGDIYRPTALAGLRKLLALIGFPLLLACWAAIQARRRKATVLDPAVPAVHGTTILEMPSRPDPSFWAGLDRAVADSPFERILAMRAGQAPVEASIRSKLQDSLDEPGVWLAYVGRKTSLAAGIPVDAPVKIGEDATWALCAEPAAALFRRDEYLSLGGTARLERAFPGSAWLALSLLGWQRGSRTLFAGHIEAHPGPAVDPEKLMLGAVSDFSTAIRILWQWSWRWRHWAKTLGALNVTATPIPDRAASPENATRANVAPAPKRRSFLPLVDPAVHVFRGRKASDAPRIAVVSPYLPFPLSHGGAIRIFNLMRATAGRADICLFAFAEQETGREVEPLLDLCTKIVLVETPRWEMPALLRLLPRGVAKFRSAAMRAAVSRVVDDEHTALLQVEYTQLAHLRPAASRTSASTILVEHDVTFDLYSQLRLRTQGWKRFSAWLEERRWRRYEIGQARRFDRVIAMSQPERNRLLAAGLPEAKVSVVENGVDLQRFHPAPPARDAAPELLFIGSFRHFPNILGFRFLLEDVWPILCASHPNLKLTVVAGADHRYYWSLHTKSDLAALPPRVEVFDFVEDVRPLYWRASVVAIPLVVSAGTNIKVLEALAMGRAVVSTEVGVAGLGLTPEENVLLADTAPEFARAVAGLLDDGRARDAIAARGRAFVEAHYGWDALGEKLAGVWAECGVKLAEGSATSSKSYRPARAL